MRRKMKGAKCATALNRPYVSIKILGARNLRVQSVGRAMWAQSVRGCEE